MAVLTYEVVGNQEASPIYWEIVVKNGGAEVRRLPFIFMFQQNAIDLAKVMEESNQGHIVLAESATAPNPPAGNAVVLYSRDRGAGKTQVVARFGTGAEVVIATEP